METFYSYADIEKAGKYHGEPSLGFFRFEVPIEEEFEFTDALIQAGSKNYGLDSGMDIVVGDEVYDGDAPGPLSRGIVQRIERNAEGTLIATFVTSEGIESSTYAGNLAKKYSA